MENEKQKCRIIAISGSVRKGSFTKMALNVALTGAREMSCETELIDLSEYSLPFCDGKEDESIYPQDVFRLREKVRGASGIILGTPEYHGGYSGVLKNALDLMGFEEFEGKMLGLVGVSGGAMGAFSALESLRNIGRALHSWVIPEQASIPQAWKVFDESGKLTDASFEKRLKEVGRQVARFAYLHSSCQANDFLKQWQTAVENPGGEASS